MDADFDDELLALAGGGEPSSPKGGRKGGKKKPKRPKVDMNSDSDMEMSSGSEAAAAAQAASSDEDDSDTERPSASNPYPLEGLYVDAADKARIQDLSELQREAILGERQEELQVIRDRENLKNMVKQRDDAADGKRSSRRDKARTGITREKENKMEELKRKRQEKGSKKAKGDDDDERTKRRKRRKADEDDWADSDEDGEVDAVEERRLTREERATKKRENAATPDQIRGITLTRRKAVDICIAKFFEEYAKGMWVRVKVAQNGLDVKYRVGEITAVTEGRKYYELKEQIGPTQFITAATNLMLIVTIGKDSKTVSMTDISNSPFTQGEWTYVIGELEKQNQSLPSKKVTEKKLKEIDKHRGWVKDEADIMAQVKAKKALRSQGEASGRLSLSDKLRLKAEHANAVQSGDTELADRLQAQLDLAEGGGETTSEAARRLAEVNERNRRANREEIRKAEIKAAEERRAQLKALEKGEAVKVDPSARLKMNVNRTHDRASGDTSRAMTPGPESNGVPSPLRSQTAAAPPSIAAAAKAAEARGPPTRFDEMVASSASADLDLGDF